MNNILNIKNKDAYPLSVKKLKKIISGNNDKSKIFGSYLFISQIYPSDIDIIEEVIKCCDKKDAIKKMLKIIKKILKEVDSNKGIYFSEFKAGIDPIFKIDISDKNFIKKIKLLYDNKYIDKNIYNSIIKNYPIKTIYNKDMINEILRNLYTLRWTEKELKNGYKILIGDRKILLKDALDYLTPIKIDILAPINNKYTEITNFFILASKDKKGNVYPINFIERYEETLREAIIKYSSKFFYNPYKLAKRMWGLSRYMYNKTKENIYMEYLKKLTPLLKDNIGILYQIKAEIEAIILIYQRSKSKPYKTLMNQIDGFKNRISYTDISDDEKLKLYKLIDSIIYNIDRNEFVITKLENIKDFLKNKINEKSIKYLLKIKMFPPPKKLI